MTRTRFVPTLAIVAFLCGTGGAVAQNVGPDEAIQPSGAMTPKLALTPAQERAIYNVVIQQRVRTTTINVPAAVGAPVPQAVELGELPDQAATDNPEGPPLKYTMVEDDVVVVDPIRMRVVDVIHVGAKP